MARQVLCFVSVLLAAARKIFRFHWVFRRVIRAVCVFLKPGIGTLEVIVEEVFQHFLPAALQSWRVDPQGIGVEGFQAG